MDMKDDALSSYAEFYAAMGKALGVDTTLPSSACDDAMLGKVAALRAERDEMRGYADKFQSQAADARKKSAMLYKALSGVMDVIKSHGTRLIYAHNTILSAAYDALIEGKAE